MIGKSRLDPTFTFIRRLGAGGIAVLLGVQGVVAYQPEKSFWEARRGAARETRGGALAFLSRASNASSSGSLVHEFPAIRSVRTSLSPSLSPSSGGALPSSFLSRHRGLLAALSPAYGTVRKVWPGVSSGKGRVVVHVQDVHQNAEAQWNIRGAVSGLLKTGQVGVVALEGATEAIDLKPFLDFPHRKAVETAADYFLKENRISGPIHALLTGQGPLPRVQGIDDPVHYEANVQAVRNALAVSPATRSALRSIQNDLDKKKETVFSPALLALDRTVTDYRNENGSLGDYVERLSATVSLPSVSLQAFRHALQTERSLDFKRVEIERSRLIEKLMHTLSPSEIDRLMAESLAYRSGQRRFAEFYGGLKILCRNHGIRLDEYPAMDAYVKYVLSVDGIDPGSLMKDLALLEKRALARLARTSEERDLIVRSRRAWLAGRLVDFALTPSEWEEWSSGSAVFSVNLAPFESFYREAHARDGAMAENLWAALKEDDVAVLVTGGFHAEGLDRQLVRRGVTVISYVPKITKVDTAQGAAYLSVFTQEKTPLEKLFRGEKLFLSANPIPPAELKIQLPMVVMLVALLTAGNLDPQLLYQALGGIGVVHDVVIGSGYAQAAVALGAGALVFRCVLKGNVIDTVDSFIKKRGLATELKIKAWDPLREQAKYFLPWTILIPFLLSLLGTHLFDGGLGLLACFYFYFGLSILVIMVPVFIEKEHLNYSFESKYALFGKALRIGVWTMGTFILTFALLAPMGLNLVEYADQFYPLIPNGDFKAFAFASFFGFMAGLLMHVVHNGKTYGHFLLMRKGQLLAPGTMLPLSRTASGKKSPPVPAFSRVKINFPKGVSRETLLDSLPHGVGEEGHKANSNLRSQLPEIFSTEIPRGNESQIEVEVARFQVSVGGDTFIISHKKPSPQFDSQWAQTEFPIERLTVETLIRDGAEVHIPVGPHGILEFIPYRAGEAITSVDAEMRHGIPHPQGERPYNAGSVLMAVLLKKVAGPHVPVRAVLAMTNATALFHLISRAQEEGWDFTFSQLQRVPAFRIPECEYTFKINNNGVAEYTVAWSGIPGSPSKIDLESAESLRTQDNFHKFIRANEGSRIMRDFGNTASSQGIRPFNIFQRVHERYAEDRGSFLKNGRYWVTHPYGGAPILESLGLLGGLKLLGDSFSGMGMVNPAWLVNTLESWGWLDPTGSVFFTSIFVAAIFSLMHPDLWWDLWAGLKEIGSLRENKKNQTVKYVVVNFLGVFSQRFIGGILFIAFLQAPLLFSFFSNNFINVALGLLLSNVVHSPINMVIQEIGIQWTARRDAKRVGEILVGPGSVKSMLLPESGPLHVEDILGPSRVWLDGVQRRLGEPGYARAFEKTFLRESNRGRSDTLIPVTVQLQLLRLVSFITGRRVNDDGPSTVINIVRLGDVPEALRSAQLTSAFAKSGRRPPRLVLAGADVATVAALRAGVDPGVVEVVAEPVAPGDQLDTAVLAKGLHGFNLPANGRVMVFLSNGVQIDPAAVSRLAGEGIELALKMALLDLLEFVRLSPIDFRHILEVVNHTSISA